MLGYIKNVCVRRLYSVSRRVWRDDVILLLAHCRETSVTAQLFGLATETVNLPLKLPMMEKQNGGCTLRVHTTIAHCVCSYGKSLSRKRQ